MNMMSDLKDMVRYHNYQMGELLELVPFEYQTIKLLIIQDLQKALLSINGASRRLGISTEEVVIILPRHDFSYFKNVLESGNGSLAKFYIHVDDDSFKLSGITISRSKGEKE